MTASWLVGLGVGLVVVLLVVVLLILMIIGAGRAADKAEDILGALYEARDNTAGLWLLGDTKRAATRIVGAAATARAHLASKEVPS